MKKTVCLLLAALALLLCGCSKNDTLYLYVLPQREVSADMSDAEIASLARRIGRLALEGEDLVGVQWDTQRFEIAGDLPAGAASSESGGSALLKTTDGDLFVWILGGRPVYVGGFARGGSNAATPRVPYIVDDGRRIFRVETDDRYGRDLRFDTKLYRYFEKRGLLRTELSE